MEIAVVGRRDLVALLVVECDDEGGQWVVGGNNIVCMVATEVVAVEGKALKTVVGVMHRRNVSVVVEVVVNCRGNILLGGAS